MSGAGNVSHGTTGQPGPEVVPSVDARHAAARGSGDDALGDPTEIAIQTKVIPDIDIWRCAALMIKRYGDTADIEPAARANEYEAKGEREGQRVWLRIAKAIDDLRDVKPDAVRH